MRLLGWLIAVTIATQTAPPSRVRILAETIPGSVAPEFAADLLIRLANSPVAAKEGAEWRAAVYRQAFELAGDAQDPAPVHRPIEPVDYRTSVIERASTLSMVDGLSLRVRAFRSLLELQPKPALELAERFDIRLPVLTCADHFVPNPTAMFDVSRSLPYESFERVIVGVRSSTALAPALYAVLEAPLNDEQIRHLLVALAAALRSVHDDDRTFTASSELIWTAVSRAIDRVDDPVVTSSLLDAAREYFVRHLTADRCAPSGTGREDFARFLEKSPVLADINRVLAAHDRPSLSRLEVTPIRVTETPIAKPLLQSQALKAVVAEIEGLRRESTRPPPTAVPELLADSSVVDFRERIGRIHEAMARWNASDEPSAADYFAHRRLALVQLIGLLKPGVDRDQALAELITMTKAESVDRYTHAEWFFPVRQVLVQLKGSPRDRDWVLAALRDSGDPVMRAYAQVEELIGQL